MMQYNVFFHDFNNKKIITYNALSGYEDTIKKLKKKAKDKDEFSELLRKEMMYRYWSRCEYETVITSWPRREEADRKIDIYEQLKLNWSIFVDYCYNYDGRKK